MTDFTVTPGAGVAGDFSVTPEDDHTFASDSDYTRMQAARAVEASAKLAALSGGGNVGDVNSTERGSGARFNAGKPAMDLVPLKLIADAFDDPNPPEGFAWHIVEALNRVGTFQVTGDRDELLAAMEALRNYWPDCARVFEYGREKYAAWNWAKGMAWSIPIACIGRHALAILVDEYALDAESGHRHEGHILCNIVMLATYVNTFPEGNDLPAPELFRAAAA